MIFQPRSETKRRPGTCMPLLGSQKLTIPALSDQLYNTPVKHFGIRTTIIEHMRTYRPLFESYTDLDGVQQRRALRSTTTATKQESDDVFEDYLRLMSKAGVYGGEPELVAFCQVYDQDVIVHLPQITDFDRDSITYTNEHRRTTTPVPLHICYGGDEVTRAHYDSARSRDGSHPRSQYSPIPESQELRRASLHGGLSSSLPSNLTARAIRNSRSDLSSEDIHDLLQKSKKSVTGTLEQLNHRARSPSADSSHHSSSSKRSLEDEGDDSRRYKRADRRRSTRKRTEMATVSVDTDDDFSFRLQIDSPTAGTPASTQDTELSSEAAERNQSEDDDYRPFYHNDHPSDSETSQALRRRKLKPSSRAVAIMSPRRTSSVSSANLVAMAERPRSTLRT